MGIKYHLLGGLNDICHCIVWSLRFKTCEVPFSVSHGTTGEGGSLQLQSIWAQPLCEQLLPLRSSQRGWPADHSSSLSRSAGPPNFPVPCANGSAPLMSAGRTPGFFQMQRKTGSGGFLLPSNPPFPLQPKAPLKCFLEPALLCPSPLFPFEAFLSPSPLEGHLLLSVFLPLTL